MSMYFDAAVTRLTENLEKFRKVSSSAENGAESAIFTDGKVNLKMVYAPDLKRFYLFRGEAGCADDAFEQIQSYYYETTEDKAADLREAMSVANEFSESFASPSAAVPVSSRAAERKDKESDETSAVFFVNRIPGVLPECREPLLQHDFVTSLFHLAKDHNIHTAIDTAGQPFSLSSDYLERFDELISVTDLFILDLKMMNNLGHKKLTGVSNENILEMARYLSDKGKEMWIRHVLVPGVTDDENDLRFMFDFISSLNTVSKVEILPYHTLGIAKWKELNIPYPLEDVPVPTKDQISRAEQLLHITK